MKIIKREVAKKRTRTITVAVDGKVLRKLDEDRGLYKEVLRVDGWEPPANRIVPLVDTKRGDLSRVLGSVRNLRSDGAKVIGQLVFAKSQSARDAEQKLDDKHINYFSVEIEPLAYETVRTWRGHTGPVRVISRWRLVCVVLKPTAALE